MEKKIVIIDTCVLIDNFRKKIKEKTFLYDLILKYDTLCISSITEFEIYAGATGNQLTFWEEVLNETKIIPFDSNCARYAADIQNQLKAKRKTIEKADLFIAATALAHQLPLATFNSKHFLHIDSIKLVERTTD